MLLPSIFEYFMLITFEGKSIKMENSLKCRAKDGRTIDLAENLKLSPLNIALINNITRIRELKNKIVLFNIHSKQCIE